MIELRNIDRVFDVGDEQVHALNNISLTIKPGEYISIMGPSGSGKSTLLNLLGLLDKPNNGSYYLDGINTIDLNDRQQAAIRLHKIGFVFQFFHLVPRLSAAKNIELPMILDGIEASTRKEKVAQRLHELGITERGEHRPDQLSGGQRQRVAIARATIMQPEIILADEPTGNLDRASGKDVVQVLEDLNRIGMTLLVVTHNPDLGKRAPRRIRMVDGAIEHDTNDPPAETRTPRQPDLAQAGEAHRAIAVLEQEASEKQQENRRE